MLKLFKEAVTRYCDSYKNMLTLNVQACVTHSKICATSKTKLPGIHPIPLLVSHDSMNIACGLEIIF
jgi:hypothetical protein